MEERRVAMFEQQRHKRLVPLERPRELVIACTPLRSNVNLSRIVRAAGCMGVRRLIACGAAKVVQKIARNSVDDRDGDSAEGGGPGVEIETHRTLPPVLRDTSLLPLLPALALPATRVSLPERLDRAWAGAALAPATNQPSPSRIRA